MTHWTVRGRILGSFAAIMALMLVMAGITVQSLMRIQTDISDIASDSVPSVTSSFEIMTAWMTDDMLTQKYLDQTDKAEQDRLGAQIKTGQAGLDALIDKYVPLISTPAEQTYWNDTKAARAPYLRAQTALLALVAGGKAAEAGAAPRDQFDKAFQTAQSAIQGLVEYDKQYASDATGKILSAIEWPEMIIAASFGGGLLLAVLCGYLLLRSIRGPLLRLSTELGTSGIQVKASVNEIAATAKEHQATASEIAATTMEIGATSKEISATSRELVKTMHEVSNVAEQSATLAGSGQAGLALMEETMRRVMEAAGSINARLTVLNEKASNISDIVTTITKVADQTNLLSLNAAIEAEKAGEHGRGFGVVAVEIRRLADQTAVATYDIGHTIKEIQSAVSASVMGMDKFAEEVRRGTQEVQQVGEQLSQIIQHAQALAPRVESVNEGMQAQASGAEQITLALGQLSEAAQQTVDSLRQSGVAIEGLNQVVVGLSGGVARLDVML